MQKCFLYVIVESLLKRFGWHYVRFCSEEDAVAEEDALGEPSTLLFAGQRWRGAGSLQVPLHGLLSAGSTLLRQRASSHMSVTSIRHSCTHKGRPLLFLVAINSSGFLCEHSNFESFSVIIYSSEDTHLLCGSRLWSFSCSTISTLLHRY